MLSHWPKASQFSLMIIPGVTATELRLYVLCNMSPWHTNTGAHAQAGGLCSCDFNCRVQIAAVIGLICTAFAHQSSCSASGNMRIHTGAYKHSAKIRAGWLHSIHRESHAVMHANPIMSGDARARQRQCYSSGPCYLSRLVVTDQVHTDVEMLARGEG